MNIPRHKQQGMKFSARMKRIRNTTNSQRAFAGGSNSRRCDDCNATCILLNITRKRRNDNRRLGTPLFASAKFSMPSHISRRTHIHWRNAFAATRPATRGSIRRPCVVIIHSTTSCIPFLRFILCGLFQNPPQLKPPLRCNHLFHNQLHFVPAIHLTRIILQSAATPASRPQPICATMNFSIDFFFKL